MVPGHEGVDIRFARCIWITQCTHGLGVHREHRTLRDYCEPLGEPRGNDHRTLRAMNQAHFATALARTRYDEAVLRFQKALWQALSDVDNGLSARAQLAEEGAAVALA